MVKVLGQTVVNGHKVRIVSSNGTYQAQTKARGNRFFDDYGPACETQDHAYYWAFEAIRNWFGDDRTLGMKIA